MRILIVDDNEAGLQSLSLALSDLGHDPTPESNGEQALVRLGKEFFPLVITDIRMPGLSGLDLLERITAAPEEGAPDVVLITGHGDMETAVAALRKGAYDYLNKPINVRDLAAVVERSAEHQALLMENRKWREEFKSRLDEATEDLRQDLATARDRLLQASGQRPVVAESLAMRRLLNEAEMYHANPAVPVLLEGETGTGKEVLAKQIHFGEDGCDAPFVAINCAAIPAGLFESELFGHEAGAYTGSSRKGARGKLELAEKGTIFLDEIAELPLAVQPKLLRVLEDGSYYRVGGVRKQKLKARVVCAANKSLEQLVEAGRFRLDLFHRLKVGHMLIPPLRERLEDIEALAFSFLLREAGRKKKRFTGLHPQTVELLQSREWPGNVRELENVVERAVLTCDGLGLLPEHLAFLSQEPVPAADRASSTVSPTALSVSPAAFSPLDIVLPEDGLNLEQFNAILVEKALEKFQGNKSKAAQYLGISRYALLRRLNKS
jgi:two-component system, NtrC family, response regulator AtoC